MFSSSPWCPIGKLALPVPSAALWSGAHHFPAPLWPPGLRGMEDALLLLRDAVRAFCLPCTILPHCLFPGPSRSLQVHGDSGLGSLSLPSILLAIPLEISGSTEMLLPASWLTVIRSLSSGQELLSHPAFLCVVRGLFNCPLSVQTIIMLPGQPHLSLHTVILFL